MKIVPMKVEYSDHMGTDLSVCDAARVSFNKESEWETVITSESGPELNKKILKESDAKLINYLAKHNHWSPFAHTSIKLRVKAPIFVARQLVKHCVTGDTEVTFKKSVRGGSNGRSKRTIAYLYDMWSGKVKYQGGKKGKLNVSRAHVKVFNESTKLFETSHITDVIYQGKKRVYMLDTESNQCLKATSDHEIFTNRGWVKLGEIIPNEDYVATESLNGELIESVNRRRDLDSRDVIARRNFEKSICVKCGSKENLECDHIIPVCNGGSHEESNLQVLCSSCHRAKSAIEKSGKNNNAFKPRWTKVLAVIDAGEEDVYDISVDKIHNFLANGIVVHNCVGAVWNEVSRRYVDSEPEFYFPDTWRARPDGSIKQGSGSEVITLVEHGYYQYTPDALTKDAVNSLVLVYNSMIESGVAPEQARMILPQNMMTEWIWTGSLMFWDRVCKLRLDPHAQSETSEIAKGIFPIAQDLFPVSWKALQGI